MNAQYEHRTRTVTTRQLVVQLPLDWKNFTFILSIVERELTADNRAQWDDACEVTANDEELIFSWPSVDQVTKSL